MGGERVHFSGVSIIVALAVLAAAAMPSEARAQRFGGQFGAAGGFWLQYLAAEAGDERSFGRDLGHLILTGGRGFLQTGRVRLGGGAFGGSFVDEGVNPSGNEVTGGLGGAGFTAEYLLVRQNLEVTVGGFIGGGTITIEELLDVQGEVETVNRVEDTIFLSIPWVRVGYNIAPFVNTGLQVGYLVGTQGFDGFSLAIDVTAGLIP